MKYCTWVGMTDHHRAPSARATRLPASGTMRQIDAAGGEEGGDAIERLSRPRQVLDHVAEHDRVEAATVQVRREQVGGADVETQAVARVGRGELARLDADHRPSRGRAPRRAGSPPRSRDRAASRARRGARGARARRGPWRAGRPPPPRSPRTRRRRRPPRARRRRESAPAACGRRRDSARCPTAPCRTGRSWGSAPPRPPDPRRAGGTRAPRSRTQHRFPPRAP